MLWNVKAGEEVKQWPRQQKFTTENPLCTHSFYRLQRKLITILFNWSNVFRFARCRKAASECWMFVDHHLALSAATIVTCRAHTITTWARASSWYIWTTTTSNRCLRYWLILLSRHVRRNRLVWLLVILRRSLVILLRRLVILLRSLVVLLRRIVILLRGLVVLLRWLVVRLSRLVLILLRWYLIGLQKATSINCINTNSNQQYSPCRSLHFSLQVNILFQKVVHLTTFWIVKTVRRFFRGFECMISQLWGSSPQHSHMLAVVWKLQPVLW